MPSVDTKEPLYSHFMWNGSLSHKGKELYEREKQVITQKHCTVSLPCVSYDIRQQTL